MLITRWPCIDRPARDGDGTFTTTDTSSLNLNDLDATIETSVAPFVRGHRPATAGSTP